MFSSWLNPTSALVGVLAVITAAYLAGVYLAADAVRLGDPALARRFRPRALAAGLLAGAVAFTFATLPVEFGASNRALALVGQFGMYGDRQQGAREVLRAAGWTYVAGALTALLTFLYYLSLFTGRRN